MILIHTHVAYILDWMVFFLSICIIGAYPYHTIFASRFISKNWIQSSVFSLAAPHIDYSIIYQNQMSKRRECFWQLLCGFCTKITPAHTNIYTPIYTYTHSHTYIFGYGLNFYVLRNTILTTQRFLSLDFMSNNNNLLQLHQSPLFKLLQTWANYPSNFYWLLCSESKCNYHRQHDITIYDKFKWIVYSTDLHQRQSLKTWSYSSDPYHFSAGFCFLFFIDNKRADHPSKW